MIAEHNNEHLLRPMTECSNSANVETFTFEIHVGGMSWNCVSRGAFLCCIRCYSGRGLYPVREKSFSYVTVLRSRIGADLSRRQFSLSAITSASTRIRSTESLPVDSGLETNSAVFGATVGGDSIQLERSRSAMLLY